MELLLFVQIIPSICEHNASIQTKAAQMQDQREGDIGLPEPLPVLAIPGNGMSDPKPDDSEEPPDPLLFTTGGAPESEPLDALAVIGLLDDCWNRSSGRRIVPNGRAANME